MKWVMPLAAGLCMLTTHAHADKVYLTGGSVVVGKATREGNKVIVEVESGQLTLPADGVERIESSESDVQRVDARLEKLKPGDVKGLMELANFCRDHEMSAREAEMLQKVIAIDPDHKEARARLGYVHTEQGWVTRESQLTAQGLVKHEGQWITREQLLALERAQAEADIAASQRDKAQVELEASRLELEKQRANREAAQTSAPSASAQAAYAAGYSGYPTYAPYSGYSVYTPYAGYSPYTTLAPSRGYAVSRAFGPAGCFDARCSRGLPPSGPRSSFPIAGVRDPFSYFR